MARTTELTLFILTAMFVLESQCQTQTPKMTTMSPPTTLSTKVSTTPDPDKEIGIIVSTHSTYTSDYAQLRHIPVMPYYQNFSGSVPGIGFTNKYIQFLSLDIDYRTKQIYLYDYYLRSIAIGYNYHAALRAEDLEFEFMHVGVSRGIIQVAVDWITHTVYWADSVYKWVVAAPGQKDKIEHDYYKIIINRHLSAPDGLALDPSRGILFVSDSGSNPKIERATMTGSNRHTIESSGLHSPRSLEADIFEARLYWLDIWYETINSIRYDGSDRRRVRLIAQSSLFDLALFRDIIAVTDIENDNLYFLNKTTGAKRASTVNFGTETMYGIAFYNIENQPLPEDPDPCAALACDHLCLLNGTGAQCVCSEGYEINSTNVCAAAPKHEAVIISNSSHICLIDLRSLAHQAYEPMCIFTVIPLYIPPPTTTTRKPVTQVPTTLSPNSTKTTGRTPSPMTKTTTTPKPATSPSPKPTAAPNDRIVMFDVDVENRKLFYVSGDNSIYQRLVDLPIDNMGKELLTAAAGKISGLAFDWLSDANLYYCESDTGNIHVVNVNDRSSSRVPSNRTVHAHDLVIMPHERKLAWIVDGVGIYTMDMTGANQKYISLGSSSAKYLVYESDEKKFYWMDTTRDEVRYVGIDETAHSWHQYTQADSSHLAIFQDFILWTYSTSATYQDYLTVYKKSTKSRMSLGYVTDFGGSITGIKFLASKAQPTEADPCRYENGNCEQICLTRMVNDSPQKECLCSLGYNLGDDKTSCESDLTTAEEFVMITDWTNDAIYQIDIETNSIQAFQSDGQATFLAVMYHPNNKKMYFSELYSDMLYRANLNGTEKEEVLNLDYSDVQSMVLDEHSGNIYFVADLWTYIGMVTPNGETVELIDAIFDTINGIAIHPGKGWIYYTVVEWLGDAYIARANMDGTDVTELIKGDFVEHPWGIAIDYPRGYLYWSDVNTDKIHRCDLDGKNCTEFHYKYIAYPTEIEIVGDFLYYVGLNQHHVTQVSLTNSSVHKELGSDVQLGRLTHLSVYRKVNTNKQPVSEACKANGGRGDCSTICLPKPNGRTCACDDGTDLKLDKKTCEDIYQCDSYIRQDNIEVTFFPDCTRYLGSQCTYRCPYGWTPVNETNASLKCQNDGWDREEKTLCKKIECPLDFPNGKWNQGCTRTIGVKCSYTCDAGFKPAFAYSVCMNTGKWDEELSQLCSGNQCSAQIDNGNLEANCKRLPNTDPCDFTCDMGYKKNPQVSKLTCQSNHEWNYDTKSVCQTISCPSTIANGQISKCESHLPGSKCNYSCNTGFVKPPGVTQMTCLMSEQWEAHSQSPCIGLCTDVQFTCGDGSCINNTRKCDGKADCKDKSDENSITCPITCPSAIANGQISKCESYFPGSKCDYSCNTGFVKPPGVTHMTCLLSEQWEAHNQSPCIGLCTDAQFTCGDGACINNTRKCDGKPDCKDMSDENSITCPITCPSTIANGQISNCESYLLGSKCDYGCNTGFVKPPGVTKMTCLKSKKWEAHGQSPCIDLCKDAQFTCGDGTCIDNTKKCDGKADCTDMSDENSLTCPSKCPSSYANGTLQVGCNKLIGSTCDVTCSTGFTNGGIMAVVCSSKMMWQPENICQPVTCPSNLPNGFINTTCGRGVNDMCYYSCPAGYTKNTTVHSVKCLPQGTWNQTTNLCNEVIVTINREKQTASGSVGEGVGIGIGVILLVIVIVVIVAFIIYKRNRAYKDPPYSMSFNTHESNIAIENPGYMTSAGAGSSGLPASNYETLNADQMQPVRFEHDPPVDHGMVNPMFMEQQKAQLPEEGQIGLSNNTVSADWLKQQENAPPK